MGARDVDEGLKAVDEFKVINSLSLKGSSVKSNMHEKNVDSLSCLNCQCRFCLRQFRAILDSADLKMCFPRK